MAVTEVTPQPAQRVVMMAGFQRSVSGEGEYDSRKTFV